MDRNLYKILVLGLCASPLFSTAYADTERCNPASIGVELTGGWFRGITDNPGYGVQAQTASATPIISGSLLRAIPNNEFNGALALSYDFPASPFTLGLTWWHVDSDKDNSATGNIGVTRTPATWNYNFAGAATSSLDYKNDILTLALGATFYLDCPVKITPQLGVSYLHTKNEQTTTYAGQNIATGSLVTIDEGSFFRGYGPSFGFDLDYLLFDCFSLFGKFLYSAFLGNIHANYNAVQTGNTLLTTDVNISTEHQILNLIQTELGFSYHFTCVNYKSQILIGYAFAKIFGGSENAYFSDDVSAFMLTTNTTDLGFQGPFARFSIDFDL